VSDVSYLKKQFLSQEITEVFIEYDGPRVYAFRTLDGGFYFAFNVQNLADCSRWLYVPTNQTRLNNLILKEVSIKSFIENAESIFTVRVKNTDIEDIVSVLAPADLPASDLMFEPDLDYLSLTLKGDGVDPYHISENEFMKVLKNFRAGMTNAMKRLKVEIPDIYAGSLDVSLGAPLVGFGSLRMLLPVRNKTKLLEDTLAISFSATSLQTTISGVTPSAAEEIKTLFFEAAPQLRAVGMKYDTISISSNFLPTTVSSSVDLTQEHRKKFVEFTKAEKVEEEVASFEGYIRQMDWDSNGFELREIGASTLGITSLKCTYDLDEAALVESLSAIEDQSTSFQALLSSLATERVRVKVGGIFNKTRRELKVLDLKRL
jgi:hypothetical protein